MKPEHQRAVATLRDALTGSDQVERAHLLAELTRTVYDHAKFAVGADVDTLERAALGAIVDAAYDYETDLVTCLRTGRPWDPWSSERP